MYSLLLTVASVNVRENCITFWSLKCFDCIDYCVLDWESLLKVTDRKLTQVKNTLIRDASQHLFWKFGTSKQESKQTNLTLVKFFVFKNGRNNLNGMEVNLQ